MMKRSILTAVVFLGLLCLVSGVSAAEKNRKRINVKGYQPFARNAGQNHRSGQGNLGQQGSNRAQTQEIAPSEAQVRDHFYQRMEARLRAKGSLRSGWQDVYVTRKGVHLYAYVESGRVKEIAIGRSKVNAALTRYAPTGLQAAMAGGLAVNRARTTGTQAPYRGESGVVGGGGLVAEKPKNPSAPSKDECLRRAFNCLWNNSASLWSRIKLVKSALTYDLDGVEDYFDQAQANYERCLGDCKEVLEGN